MFGSVVLDVAIGLVFVYLLLSLLCSTAKELVEALLKKRATELERGIVNLLGDDDAVRERLISAAQEAVKNQAKPEANAPSAKKSLDELQKHLTEVGALGLPIGWNPDDPRSIPWSDNSNHPVASWCAKVGGWLLTAIAISLGAPFWFDVLNRFMIVRSTVKPQQKSHEQASQG
jgi:hypothetical protein